MDKYKFGNKGGKTEGDKDMKGLKNGSNKWFCLSSVVGHMLVQF